jgi:hypothetical protein
LILIQVDVAEFIEQRSTLLEYERRVGAAETEAVGHCRADTSIVNALSHERRSFDGRIRIVAVDRRRDKVMLQHQDAVDGFLNTRRTERMPA